MSNDLEQQLVWTLKEIEALKKENRSLRLQLSNYIDLEDPTSQVTSIRQITNVKEQESLSHVHLESSSEEKITLFRSLFRGREDVYPVRWMNKAGKSGYSPACQNEWTRLLNLMRISGVILRNREAFDRSSAEVNL